MVQSNTITHGEQKRMFKEKIVKKLCWKIIHVSFGSKKDQMIRGWRNYINYLYTVFNLKQFRLQNFIIKHCSMATYFDISYVIMNRFLIFLLNKTYYNKLL